MTNPYPTTIIDEVSGAGVPNLLHRAWREGHYVGDRGGFERGYKRGYDAGYETRGKDNAEVWWEAGHQQGLEDDYVTIMV